VNYPSTRSDLPEIAKPRKFDGAAPLPYMFLASGGRFSARRAR
jgi:hypothetical protein